LLLYNFIGVLCGVCSVCVGLVPPFRVERHCDASRNEMGQSLVSLHSKVMWSPLHKHLQQHNSRIHLGFTMLTTMCLQFSMSNIYHHYGCDWKGRAIMWWEPIVCLFVCFLNTLWLNSTSLLDPVTTSQ
jgi:hypothetical protein